LHQPGLELTLNDLREHRHLIIRDEIKTSQLKSLPLAEGAERMASLYLVYSAPYAKGPGVGQLGEMMRESLVQFPGHA